jgi:hypothetical protein
MERDPGFGVKTAKCPVCHQEIEIPKRAVDADGNYSIQCMKCKIPVGGKIHPDPGTL